jgi:hypothetical protein
MIIIQIDFYFRYCDSGMSYLISQQLTFCFHVSLLGTIIVYKVKSVVHQVTAQIVSFTRNPSPAMFPAISVSQTELVMNELPLLPSSCSSGRAHASLWWLRGALWHYDHIHRDWQPIYSGFSCDSKPYHKDNHYERCFPTLCNKHPVLIYSIRIVFINGEGIRRGLAGK